MDDRYGTGQKGLNVTGGSNRFKFQGKQARAKRVDVDVAHKIRAEGFLDADKAQDPEVEGGSFFQQELDRSKELNVTPPFKRFYYKVNVTPLLLLRRCCCFVALMIAVSLLQANDRSWCSSTSSLALASDNTHFACFQAPRQSNQDIVPSARLPSCLPVSTAHHA